MGKGATLVDALHLYDSSFVRCRRTIDGYDGWANRRRITTTGVAIVGVAGAIPPTTS